MRTLLGWVALAAVALAGCGITAGALAGCGGETDSGSGGGKGGGVPGAECGEHPLQCAAGETCWFASASFTCQPSGSGLAGETCAPLVGQPTCTDGLLCIKAGGDGVCTPLCDPTTQDPTCGDLLCVLVETANGAQTHVCQ